MSMCSCVDPEAECGYCSLRRTIQRKESEQDALRHTMGEIYKALRPSETNMETWPDEIEKLKAKVRELEKENQSLIDELNRGV